MSEKRPYETEDGMSVIVRCTSRFRDVFGCGYTCSLPTGHDGEHAHDDTARNGGWITWRDTTRGAAYTMPLAQLVHEVRPGGDWETWGDVEEALLTSVCLCCGYAGHHQQKLEAHLAANGLTEGVYIGDDGRVRDGHHRIVAARRLGIDVIPLESREQARERWIRDHGYVDWRHRKVGDVPDYDTLHWVTAALAEEQNDARFAAIRSPATRCGATRDV